MGVLDFEDGQSTPYRDATAHGLFDPLSLPIAIPSMTCARADVPGAERVSLAADFPQPNAAAMSSSMVSGLSVGA
jgi:hypothetical protein